MGARRDPPAGPPLFRAEPLAAFLSSGHLDVELMLPVTRVLRIRSQRQKRLASASVCADDDVDRLSRKGAPVAGNAATSADACTGEHQRDSAPAASRWLATFRFHDDREPGRNVEEAAHAAREVVRP